MNSTSPSPNALRNSGAVEFTIDGRPGGWYPWLRLPLQVLFVAWALWSTAPPPMRDRKVLTSAV